MGLSGTTDSSVYEGLRDVLQRHSVTTNVVYKPDSIVKRYLQAKVDPDRIVPPTGPQSPTLDVEWRFVGDEGFYSNPLRRPEHRVQLRLAPGR